MAVILILSFISSSNATETAAVYSSYEESEIVLAIDETITIASDIVATYAYVVSDAGSVACTVVVPVPTGITVDSSEMEVSETFLSKNLRKMSLFIPKL